ncbi:hypothetical protein C8F04DRAFT_1177483 [Mycena alexandri]|uniref:Uncharacterized protein n=1 Tax=Mycena alexandri TaxID=1745969 RepID=A0AAD6S9Y3_9AGAR|nr:hypothetical protein C8F04DRAFT_1192842 [Mycena alexandri]KAJ7040877.1 hypothetical protein C8F04DRAFT_1177483 [Mycena alexandri]
MRRSSRQEQQPLFLFAGNLTFLCTAATTSSLREAQGLTTFRYGYDGDFGNISPANSSGAYHASELPSYSAPRGYFMGPRQATRMRALIASEHVTPDCKEHHSHIVAEAAGSETFWLEFGVRT